MILFPKKKSKKLTSFEKKKKARLLDEAATTQNTIKYTSCFESGVMHIVEDEYSKMYALGDIEYEVAGDDERLDVVVSYAEALNAIDKNSRYQLLVLNQKINASALEGILLPYQGDTSDAYREEINEIISERYERDQKNFEVKKYAIFTTKANDVKQASRQLNTLKQNFEKRFNDSDIGLSIDALDGQERLEIMTQLLRPGKHLKKGVYQDMALSGLSSKAFISPNRLQFFEDYFKIDNKFGKVIYVREYPKHLEDQLIQELCKGGRELAIALHAKPYDMTKLRKELQNKQTMNKAEIAKQQKELFQDGLNEDMVSGLASEVDKSTKKLQEDFRENGQKLFSGVFTTLLIADTLAELREATTEIKDIAHTWQVEFDDCYKNQEEALNTILPLGKPYLDVERNYMRDMTTNNVVTQIPFSNVELQSPTGEYYGQNQISNNLITIDRKELRTPSTLIFGSSGSGKGMTVKWLMLNKLLRLNGERFIIVDPESEYLPIGKAFGAEILDISSGTQHHLNILDMVDERLLLDEDKSVDLVKEKANLLCSLFESVLKQFGDAEAGMVDRVTRLTYERYAGQSPTLVEWFEVLKEQNEPVAQDLVIKVEPYTIGSQNIFAHPTNIDLTSSFIIFNIKKLDERMKPFAMKVILDQIWKQVVNNQNKYLTNLYFDELQLNFDTDENAKWFSGLWSRVRKYGTHTTGITQNPSVLLERTQGERMISNTELLVLLGQKKTDVTHLKKVMSLSPDVLKYVGDKVPKGSGLISAGGVIVPFENPIPKNTELFELMNTDAK
ncbi:VirB4-like conjugal transfer ATPase, CD1110 family [Lactococcus garvieae]|uniref:VirB4-like conjugal transfer ATPase, CD1110 family n=1 Tax=Lactococcus garvieae TaxID=1363 RepID=UPI003851AC46